VYRETIREMTEAERAMLTSEVERYKNADSMMRPEGSPTVRRLFLKSIFLFSGVLVCLAMLIFLMNLKNNAEIRVILCCVIIFFGIMLFDRLNRIWSEFFFDRSTKRWQRNTLRKMEQTISDGRVIERQIQARSVVEFRSPIEECDGLVFDLGDDRVFLVHNDGNFPSESDTDLWPNSDFEVVHTRSQTRILNLVLRGSLLTPIRVLSANQFDQDKFWRLKDGLIETDLQSFIDSLQL